MYYDLNKNLTDDAEQIITQERNLSTIRLKIVKLYEG